MELQVVQVQVEQEAPQTLVVLELRTKATPEALAELLASAVAVAVAQPPLVQQAMILEMVATVLPQQLLVHLQHEQVVVVVDVLISLLALVAMAVVVLGAQLEFKELEEPSTLEVEAVVAEHLHKMVAMEVLESLS